jgi:hypothetical protein
MSIDLQRERVAVRPAVGLSFPSLASHGGGADGALAVVLPGSSVEWLLAPGLVGPVADASEQLRNKGRREAVR